MSCTGYIVKILNSVKEWLSTSPARNGDVGYDVFASETVTIPAKGYAMVNSKARIQMPHEGYLYCDIRGRSSLARKGIFCFHGLIDSGYTGELGIILFNLSDTDYVIEKGHRIAQLVFHRRTHVRFEEVDMFEPTDRNDLGFGSTGL